MRVFFYIIISIGMLLVLYLSWVSSPAIGKMSLMPSWISNWVDTYRFSAIRTAVPMVVLGALAGIYLNYEKMNIRRWYAAWLFLTLLILLAEIGQHFRPMRYFDIRDIFWGSVGSALGLICCFFLKEGKCYIKRK